MDKKIETIYKGILDGDQHLVAQQVTDALKAGLSPDMILKEGLVAAMSEVHRHDRLWIERFRHDTKALPRYEHRNRRRILRRRVVPD